jgi:hypothetical protein
MKNTWIYLFIISLSYSLLITSCSDDVVQPEPPSRLVILYYPEYDQVVPDTPITFRWGTTTSAADSFKLEITQDSTFATGVFRYGVTSPQYTINPAGDTNYFYWKVTGYWRSVPDSDVSIIQKFKQR